jgi:hypothetical protein
MTRLALDKNPKQYSDEDLSSIMKIFELNTLNSIMFSDPFLKTIFLNKLILKTNTPIFYLDFDLLYSGYVTSNIISLRNGVTLYRPTKDDWIKTLKTILLKLSENKSILIMDSLNGLFNLHNEKKDAGRLINSYIMFLSCVAKMSNSCIVLPSIIRKKNDEGWALSITGRHVIESKQMNRIQLDQINSNIIANVIGEKDNTKQSIKIPIQSELI